MHPKISQKTMQALSALLLVLLTACGSGNATPTVSVEAIYTAAYNTMMAAQATQLAQTPPTATPTQTLVPTLAPPPTSAALPTLALLTSPTAGSFNTGGGACDSSAFAGDVTIPDNTVMDAGKTFTKTWSLLNNGSCTWSTSYSLQFDSGDQMGGATVAMPSSVGPGSTVSISVKLTAPTSKGTYKGIWRLHNASGTAFGDTPWVIIKVGTGTASGTAAPTAAACGTGGCVVTVTANVPDFQVEFTDSKGGSTPSCTVPSGGSSCSFTVTAHWDGAIVLHKGKYTFSPSSYTFTNVTTSFTVNFTGSPGTSATATPTP